jgi:hypothetical protein
LGNWYERVRPLPVAGFLWLRRGIIRRSSKFMDTQTKGWKEVIKAPFKGKRFYLYGLLALLPWQIVKQIIREGGIVLGGIPSFLLLLFIIWVIGTIFIEIGRILRRNSS